MRVVIDTNFWIRILLGGSLTLPILTLWEQSKFDVLVCQELLDELEEVAQRSRLQKRIKADDAERLLRQLQARGLMVELETTPPSCRDPKDQPVLATAIDGKADAIVTGDADLRADDILRQGMKEYGIELWGIQTLLEKLNKE